MGLPMLLAAGESEQTFWVNLLLVVILAAGWGVFGLFRTRTKRGSGRVIPRIDLSRWYARLSEAGRFAKNVLNRWREGLSRVAARPVSEAVAVNPTAVALIEQAPKPAGKKRDLQGGMELLEAEFLVGIVERVGHGDFRDVVMHKLVFAELMRRGVLSAVNSDALKVYVLDKGGRYGKRIQCEAMKELASRTGEGEKNTIAEEAAGAARGLNG